MSEPESPFANESVTSTEPSTETSVEHPIGHTVGGKYQVLSLLGEGGMGTVYRVRQIFLNSDMALKLLSKARVNDSVYIRRFKQEAKAAFSLDHPSLVKVHDYGLMDNGQPYLVMDFIEGVTLADHLKQHKTIALQDMNAIFAQVCFALTYAHDQKVVHRDIKPGNIMLVKGLPLTQEGSVKIVDFGLAKIAATEDEQALTRTGELIGSPMYMSPEQCSGEMLDHRSDVYSLGCVLFEALTGTPPFIAENSLRTMMMHQETAPPTLKEASGGKSFPPGIEAIVAKMLAKSPGERFQDLAVVAHEFSLASSGSYRVLQPKPKAKGPSLPPVKVSRLQLALSIACTMLGSIGLTAFAMNALTPATAVKQAATAPDPMVAATRLGDAADEIASVQSGKTKTNATDSNNAPARKRIKPLRSKIVIFNGSKYRQIDFPVECLGEVTSKIAEEECVYANRNYPGPNIHVPALSTRYFPANVPLTFKINLEKYPDALRNIEIVRTIGPDEFEGISLKQCAIDDNSHETQRAFMRQALAMASTWPKLHGLEMQNMQLGDEEMAYIKDMHALRILDLDDTSIEVAALKSSEVLSRINALIVGKVELEPITRGLQYGSRLKFLILDRCDCSARSIDYLHACKQLEIVKVSRSTLSDDVLKSLAGIPNLRQLQIFDYHLSATQLRMLLRSETLKELDLPASNLADARAAGIKDGRLKGLVEVKKGTLLD